MILNWLKRPYPILETLDEKLSFSLIAGLMVGGVLLLFRPFGLHADLDMAILIALSFGAVTTVTALTIMLLFPWIGGAWYRSDRWNIAGEFLLYTTIVAAIAVGNWWLNEVIARIFELPSGSFVGMLKVTLQVAFFPVSVTLFYSERALGSKHRKRAKSLSDQLRSELETNAEIRFTADGEEQSLVRDSFYFAKAEGNYVSLQSAAPVPALLRMTLSQLEEAAKEAHTIVRCHRSWMVNLDKVTRVSGNARGYMLHLGDERPPVPISRRLSATVLASLEQR